MRHDLVTTRRSSARWLTALGVLSLMLAACGTSSRVATVDRTDATAPNAVEPDGATAAETVSAAALALSTPSSYRVTSSSAQVLEIAALDAHTVQELDDSRPTTTAEIAANGDTHLVIDLGPILGPLMSGNPGAAEALDATQLELWTTSDTIYIDSTGYQALADLNPTADLGPFAPGVGTIDLTRFGAATSDDLVAAMVGSGVPNPAELAESLPAALDAVAADPAHPGVFTATATYAQLLEALGSDLDQMSHSAAAPIAGALEVDADELASFYSRFFRATNCDVIIAVGPDGVLSSLEYQADLSPIFEAMFDSSDGLDIGSARSRDQVRTMFDGAVWTIRVRTTFQIDDSITVTPPVGELEDRTDAAIELLG